MISQNAPKLLMALLILSFTALFTSCGEDDPTNSSANSNLQGEWNGTSFLLSGTETLGTTNSELTLTFTSSGESTGSYQESVLDINNNRSQRALSYEVLDNGDRIEIGSDTLEMSVSENNLMLDGTLQGVPFAVIANK